MQGRRLRGLGRVRRRVQLPLLELPCDDGLGLLALGRDRAREAAGDHGCGHVDSRLAMPHGHHARRCGKCFSLLYWTGYEGKIRVPYGSLIDEPTLKPTAHMFVGSKAAWHEILDDLPQHDEDPWS